LQLTCLAIPKSASLTTPEESTSKLAPLISIYEYMKRKGNVTIWSKSKLK
jgi:hypothetical protein